MSLSRKIAKNTAIQVGGKLIGTVLSLIAAGMIFRHLGTYGTGQYTLILSFLQVFGILMDFGLYITLVKKIAVLNEQSMRIANNIFTLRVVSGIFFLGLAPVIAWIIGFYNGSYSTEVLHGVILTTLFFFFISLNQLLSAIFQKFLRTDWIALAEFIGKSVLLIATLIVVFMNAGLIWVMLTLVVSSGANFLTNFIASRRYVKLRLALNWDVCRSIIVETWPIAISIGFTLLYFKGDVVILSFFEGESMIGFYGAPYKILEVLVTFPAMFTGLVLPVITAAWQKGDVQRFQKILQKSFDALILIAVPMIAGTLILAPSIIQLIAGSDFTASEPILRILIIATAAIYIGTLFGYLIVSLNKQKAMLYGYGFVAITALVLYFFAIPRFSIFGAAWVTVYSEVAVLFIAMWIVLRTSKILLRLSILIKSVVAAALMAAVLYGLTLVFTQTAAINNIFATLHEKSDALDAAVELLIMVPVGAVFYAGLLFAMKAVKKDDVLELIRLRQGNE